MGGGEGKGEEEEEEVEWREKKARLRKGMKMNAEKEESKLGRKRDEGVRKSEGMETWELSESKDWILLKGEK